VNKNRLFRGAAVLAMFATFGVVQSVGSSPSGAAGAPIEVGVICTCSGSFGAAILASEDVYISWVKTVNASGGIDGHQIKLILEDDAANPGTSATEAKTLISDHVDAIVDDSIVDQTWASTVQASHIPVVGIDETETPFYTESDFYPEGQTNNSVTLANSLTAKAAGAANMGDLYCAEAASCAEGVPLIEAAGKKVGVPVVYNAEIAATAPNYTAQCVAAQQDKVKSIFIGDEAFVIVNVATNCAQQNYQPIYVTEGEGFSYAMAAAPGLKDKLWSDYGTLPIFAKNLQITAMNKAVNKYYPGLETNATSWTQIGAEGWASGLLLDVAVKGGGLTAHATPSASEILKGLNSIKGNTLGGMAPPLTFKAGQDHSINCWFTARVQNGKPSLVNSGRVTCAK
jgi:branched-chain amino acid transport system substrate-binding protein